MAAGLADALLAGLAHRAHGLRQYLDVLYAESVPADRALRRAIDLMREAATATVKQAEINLRVPDADAIAVSLLDPLIANLRSVQHQADLAFARGQQPRVHRSLVAAVQREIDELGVGPVLPVLTVGPPGNYETFVADLHQELFKDISGLLQPPPGERVCLISVPYVEGTRALWQPLVLGHEVGHLAVHDNGTGLDVDAWIGPDDAAALPEAARDGQNAEVELRRRLDRWVGEVLCDLRSVARFGAAGLAAQADFLHAVGANSGFETHPPRPLRIEFMLDFLGARGTGSLPDGLDGVVEPWRPAQASRRPEPAWVGLLWRKLDEHRDEILAAAAALPGSGRYDHTGRAEAVAAHSDRLAHGIPGSVPAPGGDQQIQHADLLTAGWLARLDHMRAGAGGASALQERLSTLDSLVGKAVDDLHFTELWAANGGQVGPPPDGADDDTAHLGDGPAGGVLPASEIRRRLRAGAAACDPAEQGDALIATPLFPDAVAGASLDVHLGSQFIVFKRTATASFRSDNETQDPRGMQELVEKDWGERFVLHPGELVLAATLEYLGLPADLTAQVITRSSYGRLGLLSATAVQVQPQFRGCLTLELVNLGQMPLELAPAERIAQLVFQRVVPPSERAFDKYRFPVGPEFSKVKQDRDLPVHRSISDQRGTSR